MGNKSISMENQNSVVPRINLSSGVYAFKLTANMPRECNISTLSTTPVSWWRIQYTVEMMEGIYTHLLKKPYHSSLGAPSMNIACLSSSGTPKGDKAVSILSLIRCLPIKNTLLIALMNATEVREVDELRS